MYNSILILTLFLIYVDKKIEILRISFLSTIKIEAKSKLLKKTWVKQVKIETIYARFINTTNFSNNKRI